MFNNKTPMSSAVFTSMLGGETLELIFAHQLADENGWHFIGFENDCFKFHDLVLNKEILMSVDEIMTQTVNSIKFTV